MEDGMKFQNMKVEELRSWLHGRP